MYSVLVAEDEPLALKTVCSIIQKHCPAFQVTATAQDGSQALSLIRQTRPDLVVCDIMMPRPTGVELASVFRTEQPDICFIIISGYPDFEFTQSAIRSGVIDYLLKPITPSILKGSMELAAERIRYIHYQARNRLLRMLGRGENIDLWELRRYFQSETYYGILARKNGLPQRFSIDLSHPLYSDIDDQVIVFGRDEMEALFLIPANMVSDAEPLETYLERARGQFTEQPGYSTLLYDSRPYAVDSLGKLVRNLFHMLRVSSTVGLSQTIDLNGTEGLEESMFNSPENSDWSGYPFFTRLDRMAASTRPELLRNEIQNAYLRWSGKNMPQYWLEHFTRDLFPILLRHGRMKLPLHEFEYLIDETFYNAVSAEQLTESVLSLLFEADPEEQAQKADSEMVFEHVTAYLEAHLSESLSLQDVCGVFSYSQSYISKLFRRYSSQSYNKYMTELRVNRAKELLRSPKGLHVREVAQMVGYADPFYFSRIFRSYTGKSPTEYVNGL